MPKNSTTIGQQQQNELVNLYAAIMEEVKVRVSAIETGLGTMRVLLPGPLTSEFCFLQIRMICELVAFSCLVAHGDITADGRGRRLHNEWSAELIMTELEKLHPHFFPRAIKMTAREAGAGAPRNLHLEERPGQITKSEFLQIYGRSGGALHRGTLNKLVGRKAAKPIGDEEIKAWGKKLQGLLTEHRIASWDNLRQIICVMRAPPNGRVSVAFAQAPEETSVEYAQSLFPKDT